MTRRGKPWWDVVDATSAAHGQTLSDRRTCSRPAWPARRSAINGMATVVWPRARASKWASNAAWCNGRRRSVTATTAAMPRSEVGRRHGSARGRGNAAQPASHINGGSSRLGQGDQVGQARQCACAHKARQHHDGAPPRPGERAQPRGLAREHAVHGF